MKEEPVAIDYSYREAEDRSACLHASKAKSCVMRKGGRLDVTHRRVQTTTPGHTCSVVGFMIRDSAWSRSHSIFEADLRGGSF